MTNTYIKHILIGVLVLFCQGVTLLAQETSAVENIKGKGRVVDKTTIKLRWVPANPKTWLNGRNYGYTLERYTMMINDVWQDNPSKKILDSNLKVKPLADWEQQALKSDYAAVLAQAFYGEDFDLNASANDVGSIINRSSELDQRFSTSAFMAEYDYKAAELAGWAFSDNDIKENERYLYRIILNRPIKQVGDTAAIYIGYADKEELLPPMELGAKWGDKSVMLTWNYELRSREYHSYHVEKKSIETGSQFKRITELPVTVLDANMQEAFHIDTLKNNDVEYSYRIVGLTSFGEEGPVSNIVTGKGEKLVSCTPQIYAGNFISENNAEIFWEFECEELDYVEKLQLSRSEKIDGDYSIVADSIGVKEKTLIFEIAAPKNYLKLIAVNRNKTQKESYPFQLQQIDSIPPAIPIGLEVIVDSVGVAYLTWQANVEPDFRGYRILRSFSKESEKSVLNSQLIGENNFTDTLSLNLLNEKVYYALTALDIMYNESEPCVEVAALKPNNSTPHIPLITYSDVSDGTVTLEWLVDSTRNDLTYYVDRIAADTTYNKTIYIGSEDVSALTDQPEISGEYQYFITAVDRFYKRSQSPAIGIPVSVSANNKVSNFNAYTNVKDGYIELSWKKHPKALLYRIYKTDGETPITLWKELDSDISRIVDERVSPDTKYTYTILFTTQADGPSIVNTIFVNY